MRHAFLLLTLTLGMGCPTPQDRCAPSCDGCCDATGICQAGLANDGCGASGSACTRCGAGLQCTVGVCSLVSTGGSGGGVGGGLATGGGSGTGGGGGVASIDQDLVSGTRLRAITWVGDDGAKSAWLGSLYFWDSVLGTVCALTPLNLSSREAAALGVCLPVGTFEERAFYSDSLCTAPLGSAPKSFLGRVPKAYLPKRLSDGGYEYFEQSTASYVGAYWSGASACTAMGTVDAGVLFGPTGPSVSLVRMNAQIE